MSASRYRWNGKELVSVNETATVPLLAADSFLIRDGLVVAHAKHQARFTRTVERQGLVFPIDDFLASVSALLPTSGEFFPRVDLTERGELELWIRPAPALGRTVSLSLADTDPRTHPRLKGPDLPALATLREQALSVGADDAIIVDSHGYVLDGATTCLLWWRENVLYTPPVDAERLDSITERVVLDMAQAQGIECNFEWATAAELSGLQVWAVNSLHGIRGVSSWNGYATSGLDEPLLDQWRSMYLRQFESVKK